MPPPTCRRHRAFDRNRTDQQVAILDVGIARGFLHNTVDLFDRGVLCPRHGNPILVQPSVGLLLAQRLPPPVSILTIAPDFTVRMAFFCAENFRSRNFPA